MRTRTFSVRNETWEFVLHVRIGGDEYSADQWSARIFRLPARDRGDAPSDGTCYCVNGRADVAIWLRRADAQLVAHEALHLVAHVMHTVGMEPMSIRNDEAYAYLLGWVVSEITQRAKGKR
jgi:hypothetical protein